MAVVLRRFTTTFLMIVFGQVGFADEHKPEVVARVGKRIITRREIACDVTSDQIRAVAAEQRRNPEAVCLEREQLRLDSIVTQELHDEAARKLAFKVSAEELAADAAFHHYDEAEFVRLSDHYRRLAQAALLVYQGEDFHVVYQRDVQRGGRPESEGQFQSFVAILQSAEGAQRFIKEQTPDHFRDSIIEDARRRLARDKLMQRLSDQAESRKLTYSEYSDEFWSELVKQVGVEILDRRYKVLSLRGLAWQPKPQPLR